MASFLMHFTKIDPGKLVIYVVYDVNCPRVLFTTSNINYKLNHVL